MRSLVYYVAEPSERPSDAALLADAKAHDRAVIREAHARKLAPLGAYCHCDTCSDVEGV